MYSLSGKYRSSNDFLSEEKSSLKTFHYFDVSEFLLDILQELCFVNIDLLNYRFWLYLNCRYSTFVHIGRLRIIHPQQSPVARGTELPMSEAAWVIYPLDLLLGQDRIGNEDRELPEGAFGILCPPNWKSIISEAYVCVYTGVKYCKILLFSSCMTSARIFFFSCDPGV